MPCQSLYKQIAISITYIKDLNQLRGVWKSEWILYLSTLRSQMLDEKVILRHRSHSSRGLLSVREPQRTDST